MDLAKLITESGESKITLQVTPTDLQNFANHILKTAQKKFQTVETPPIVKYLTTNQVCELLSISRITLWSWDKKGITRPHRIGNLKRYKLSDIEALLTAEV